MHPGRQKNQNLKLRAQRRRAKTQSHTLDLGDDVSCERQRSLTMNGINPACIDNFETAKATGESFG